jgi:hypothetical protein
LTGFLYYIVYFGVAAFGFAVPMEEFFLAIAGCGFEELQAGVLFGYGAFVDRVEIRFGKELAYIQLEQALEDTGVEQQQFPVLGVGFSTQGNAVRGGMCYGPR